MAIRNLEWYNLYEQRSYPLADQATGKDDKGKRLPNDIVVDVNLRFPQILGEKAFLSAVAIGPGIATVTILGSAVGTPPVAAVSIAAPIEPFKPYSLEALYPGVGGWIVFGSALLNNKLASYNFSTVEQSALVEQTVRRYKALPVSGFGKLAVATPLTGLIRLEGGEDVETVKEEREINNIIRDAIVIRLKNKPGQNTGGVSAFQKYLGPCDGRPESGTCGNPPPIEFINSVAPDCCGNITIEFRGCADISFASNESCSILLGCSLSLQDACVSTDKLPTVSGVLPNEYLDVCVSESIFEEMQILSVDTPSNFYVPRASVSELDSRLPYIEDFSSRRVEDVSFIQGKFSVVADSELPIFGGYSLQSNYASRTLAIFNRHNNVFNDGWSNYYRSASLHLSLRNGPPGTLHNGALVFGYTANPKKYYTAEIDFEGTFTGAKSFRIARNTAVGSATLAQVIVPNLYAEVQYNIDLKIFPAGGDAAWVIATLTSNPAAGDDLFIHSVIGPVLIENFGDGSTYFGVSTYRAVTQFNRLVIDNVEAPT